MPMLNLRKIAGRVEEHSYDEYKRTMDLNTA